AVTFSRQPTVALFLFAITTAAAAGADDLKREALWAAVRSGDVNAVRKEIEKGADPNARNAYGVSALWIAAGNSKTDIVELLVSKGADVNSRDGIWYQTPLSSAVGASKLDTVKLLIKAGAKDVDAAAYSAAVAGRPSMLQTILDLSKVSQET